METVVAGSYDRFLFGYECSTSGRQTEDYSLNRTFTYPAHKGPVKCVAAGLPYIASGGADDLIHLYEMKSGTDLGFLMSPGSGAVSALAWHSPSQDASPTHLLSGAADGGISVWQAGGDWTCYKTLYSHKKEVTSIAIHSSGRLCLSTSRQNDLKLWNLVKGKCVHTTKMPSTADQIAFRPSRAEYAMLRDKEVLLYAMDSSNEPMLKLPHDRRLHCMAGIGSDLIATGSEGGSIAIWDQRSPGQPVLNIPRAHQTRVRGLSNLHDNQHLASASSDGVLRVWDLRNLSSSTDTGAKPIGDVNTGARLTCLASIDLSKDVMKAKAAAAPKKQKGTVSEKSQAVPNKNVHSAENAQQKRQKSAQSQKRKVTGTVHDGVVDFPDEDEKSKQKESHTQASARRHGKKKARKTA